MLNFAPTAEQTQAMEAHERLTHLLAETFKAFVASEKSLVNSGIPAFMVKEIRASSGLEF